MSQKEKPKWHSFNNNKQIEKIGYCGGGYTSSSMPLEDFASVQINSYKNERQQQNREENEINDKKEGYSGLLREKDSNKFIGKARPFHEWPWRTRIKYWIALLISVSVYFITNIVLNLGNKQIFSKYGFKFPIFMTGVHALVGGVLGLFYIKVGERNPQCIKYRPFNLQMDGFSIVALSFFTAMNVGMNNASLVFTTVQLNQIVRSSIPVATAIFGVLIQQKRYTLLYWMGLALSTSGVAFAVYGNPGFNMIGFILALLSGIFAALMVACNAYLMQEKEKIDSINMTIRTAIPTFCFCMIPFVILELTDFAVYSSKEPLNALLFLLGTGFVAFVYNIFHLEVIFLVGGANSAVIGNFRMATVIMIAQLISGGQDMKIMNWIGIAISISSPFFLAVLTYKNMAEKKDDSSNDCFVCRSHILSRLSFMNKFCQHRSILLIEND